MTITVETLRDVAEQEHSAGLTNRSVDWPDCYDVSYAIKQRLLAEYDIDGAYLEINQYVLPGELHHYALSVSAEVCGEDYIIDASFNQFADETAVPIDIAPARDIDNVAIVPERQYVFSEHEC